MKEADNTKPTSINLLVFSFRSFLVVLLFFLAPFYIYSQAVFDTVVIDTSGHISTTFRPGTDSFNTISDKQKMMGADSSSLVVVKPEEKTVTRPARKFYWNSAKALSDSTLSGDKKLRRHKPLYAALFSMALPGLGQAYNRKYWKIPIVYAGLGGLGYGIYALSTAYNGYRRAYRLQVDEDSTTYGSYKGVDNVNTLKSYRDYNKNNLDIVTIVTVVWYALNIVDAAVDAHLFEWNMKDDIHLSWQPSVLSPQTNYSQTSLGVKLALNF